MVRVLSGLQASGSPTLGNYVGAMRHWADGQHSTDAWFFIADLHALTTPREPGEVGRSTREMVNALIAVGLDPDVCTLFVQSHVPEHTELAWLFECTVSMGELRRMTQFKDKSDGKDFISAGLFTYPALMAADIVLYDADQVPVGEDQKQHVELTRDIVQRFNSRYGDVLTVPTAVIPKAGARVKDLQEPTRKMSKSAESDAGTVFLFEDPEVISKKIKRAVTDSDNQVRYDPQNKPGVTNLLDLLSAATGTPVLELADNYTQYGPLKSDTADAVCSMLEPMQARYAELMADPAETDRVLRVGAEKASAVASVTLARAKNAIGLLGQS